MSQLAFGDAGLSVAVAFFAVNSFIMHTVAVRLLPGVNTRGSWKSRSCWPRWRRWACAWRTCPTG